MRYTGPHQQLLAGHCEDPDGAIVLPLATRIWPPRFGRLHLNHYAAKSRQQALDKIARGRPMQPNNPARLRSASYIDKFDLNDVEDRSILRHSAIVRRQMAAIDG